MINTDGRPTIAMKAGYIPAPPPRPVIKGPAPAEQDATLASQTWKRGRAAVLAAPTCACPAGSPAPVCDDCDTEWYDGETCSCIEFGPPCPCGDPGDCGACGRGGA